MVEEHEIEEGEIYDDSHIDLVKIQKEEDEVEEGELYDDSHIDIDAKIQSVLGDYMKDFEGAVSDENLGRFCRLINFDLHPGSDKTHCPELTSGDKPPVVPFIIQGDSIRCAEASAVCEDDMTRVLHALYQSLIQNNFQNHGAKGSVDVKAHNGREVSKKSKVIQTEEKKSSRSNGEGKSRTRDAGIKDSAPIDREHQTNKYRVKHQSEAECGMMRKPVYKKAIGYGKVARPYIAFW
ncbi:hypothetical protein MTR67_036136 [Solanum verrucosum]|uniref:Uncharacterized protein n=1 Tax=Solanum verrucosum TaxID=315347 RepID=A0AAF0ZKM4_SOLVR|nr:hypothetical protein MTR67_036136 [Solanum verrucosum]